MPVANSSNITTIQILRSYSNTTPTTLDDGQLAYSFVSNTLYIGSNTGIRIIGDPSTAVKSQAAYDQANTATVLANGAYFHANGAFLKANAGYDQANTGTVLAQAAFDKANTGGVITGNVYISNDLSVANTITTNTLNISTNTSNVSLTRGTGITSWNYSGKFKSVASEESNPSGIFFSPDGFNMYVNGSTGDDVNQYTLLTAWDVSTASYVRVFSTSAQDSAPSDLFFKPDGLSMFILGQTNDRVFQYTLSSAWNISTASYSGISFSVTTQETSPAGLWFKPDGTVMYVVGVSSDTVFQYDLGTAWDVSTASYSGISFSVASQEANPTQVNLSDAGTKMWITGQSGDDINEYTLATPWNVSTATFVNNFYVGFQDVAPNGLFIDSTAENRVYVVGPTNDAIYQYNTNTNSIDITTDVLTVNNNARIQGNLSVQSSAYVDGLLIVQGATTLSTTTIGGTLTGASTLSLTGATNSTTLVGTSATTGTTTIGGTTQTANITFGQSTLTQTTNVAIGNTAAGSTKTIDFGINAGPRSNTRINIGPTHPGANGNVTFNPATTVAIQNTRASTSNTTGALTVLGGLGVSGNVYADAIYDGGVEVLSYLQGVDNTQNTRLTVIEATDVSQNVRLDFSNTRMNISDGVNASQNVRLDFSNTRMTIIEGVDVGQNTRMAVIEGVDLSQNVRLNFSNTRMDISDGVNASQNVRLDFSNTRMTIIEGVDATQNTRLTVAEATDVSQNVRLDFSNAAITIIQGVDVGQNNRMTIIEGVDVSQNARMTISDGVNASQNVSINTQNSFITIIQGVDVGQNNAIAATNQKMESAYAHANNANVTAKAAFDNSNTKFSSSGGSITGPVSIINGNDLTVTGNLIVLGNVATENVSSFTVADPLIVLGTGNYFNDVKDIGIAAHYNNGVNAHTGIIRDSEIKEWIFFEGYTPELDANNNINIANSSFAYANVYANWFKGNILAQTVRVNGLDVFSFSTAAFNAANTAQVKTDAAFAQANITIGVDTTQNTRLTVIEGTDVSQNSRMTIIEGVDVTQNTRMTVSDGVDASQNVSIATQNSFITIIQGVDVGQNNRMTIIEGTDASQNVRLDYSNTALTIAQGVDDSQNVRLNFSNTAINQIQSAWTANTVIVANSAGFLSNSVMRFDASNSQLHSMANLSIGTTVASAPLTLSKTFLLPTAAEQFGQLNSVAYNVADTNLKQGLRLNTVAQHTSGNITNLMGMLNLCTAGGVGGTTDSQYCFWARNDVSAGAFATNSYNYFSNNSGGLAGPSNQYGFYSANLTKGLLSNYGFYGAVNTGNNAFNLYMAGSAPNYLAGSLTVANNVPSTSNTTGTLVVTGGLGVSGNTYLSGNVIVANTSTNLNTLQISQGSYSQESYFGLTNSSTFAALRFNITPATGGAAYSFNTYGSPSSAGATQFLINHTSSAVNYIQVAGNATGQQPYFLSAGSDTNVGITYATKGTGPHFFSTGGGTLYQFEIASTASAVNYVRVTGAATGGTPTVSAQGSDSNITLLLTGKGSGGIVFDNPGYGNYFSATSAGATTTNANHIRVTGTISGVPAVIGAVGSDTNIGINITPKGNGSANVTSTANSTSNTTGALVVTGGMGITGNVFLSSANNYVATTSGQSYRLGWTDNYFVRDDRFTGVKFVGAYFDVISPLITSHSLIARTFITNDQGNNVVIFAGSSPVRIQNTAASTSNTTGSLIVGGGVGISGDLYAGRITSNANSSTGLVTQFTNTNNQATTGKNISLNFSGVDTVGTVKNLGSIVIQPNDINHITDYMSFNTRVSDTVAERLRIDANGSLNVLSTIASTSNTTGALIVNGGLGLSGNLSMNLASSGAQINRITLGPINFIDSSESSGHVRFAGTGYYYFSNSGGVYNDGTLFQRGLIRNDLGNNTVLFAGSSPVKIQNGTASSNTTSGALVVQGGVGISGALNATTKSFNIPHPTKVGKNLRYGSLEGPEFGVYVRGTLKGSNTIELPDYWTKLVDANTITVSLTPIGKHQKLSVKEVKDNTIIINSDGWFKKEIHCYYTVFGERADVDKLDVEV